jgi:hypothetical protein
MDPTNSITTNKTIRQVITMSNNHTGNTQSTFCGVPISAPLNEPMQEENANSITGPAASSTAVKAATQSPPARPPWRSPEDIALLQRLRNSRKDWDQGAERFPRRRAVSCPGTAEM